jgi:hypothetical protein
MPSKMMQEELVDAAAKTARVAERRVGDLVKKAWSIMDAASEKKTPSEYLSRRGTRSIQGRVSDA